MRSPYANIKNKSPRLISNQHNIKGPNKEKELRNQNEKKKKAKHFCNLQWLQYFTNTFHFFKILISFFLATIDYSFL
jgi:hypothetical protein